MAAPGSALRETGDEQINFMGSIKKYLDMNRGGALFPDAYGVRVRSLRPSGAGRAAADRWSAVSAWTGRAAAERPRPLRLPRAAIGGPRSRSAGNRAPQGSGGLSPAPSSPRLQAGYEQIHP